MTDRWNYYRCNFCFGFFVTVDVDEGVTPMMTPCKATPRCKGTMYSAGYLAPELWPATAPRVADAEWFRPTPEWIARAKKKFPNLYEHIKQGGLVLRPPSPTTPSFPDGTDTSGTTSALA